MPPILLAQLTGSEQAIVEEIISSNSVNELVLLGQRLDALHAFSGYAIYLAIGLGLIALCDLFKLNRIRLLFQLGLGVLLFLFPAIPYRMPDESILQLPLFAGVGIFMVLTSIVALIHALFKGASQPAVVDLDPTDSNTESTVEEASKLEDK